MPENPDQVLEIGDVMRRFVQFQEFVLFAHLLENERMAQAIAMLTSPETTKDYAAGFVAGMEAAGNFPRYLIEQADHVAEVRQAQEKARYEMGGQGEASF